MGAPAPQGQAAAARLANWLPHSRAVCCTVPARSLSKYLGVVFWLAVGGTSLLQSHPITMASAAIPFIEESVTLQRSAIRWCIYI